MSGTWILVIICYSILIGCAIGEIRHARRKPPSQTPKG